MPSAELAFEHLYDRYFEEVLAYCLRRTNPADAHDVTAEVFLTAWRRIEDVPDGEGTLPWLLAVAYRSVGHQWRSAGRWRRLLRRAEAGVGAPVAGPEAVVVRAAEVDQAVAAASRLSQRDQEVLRLAAWEGLPHAQIAEVLGCSHSAVAQRLHRARRRLLREYERLDRGFSGGREQVA